VHLAGQVKSKVGVACSAVSNGKCPTGIATPPHATCTKIKNPLLKMDENHNCCPQPLFQFSCPGSALIGAATSPRMGGDGLPAPAPAPPGWMAGWNNTPMPTYPHDAGRSGDCQIQKGLLTNTYVDAYLRITRLITTQEKLIHEDTCDQNVKGNYRKPVADLEQEIKVIDERVAELEEQLDGANGVKPQIEDLIPLVDELEKYIVDLHKKCIEAGELSYSLSNVKDALEIMAACPGLNMSRFSLPTFHAYTTCKLSIMELTDDEADSKMDEACRLNFNGTRAAEDSELSIGTIVNAPSRNQNDQMLIGTCPDCDGEDVPPSDYQGFRRKLRFCWHSQSLVNTIERANNCGEGNEYWAVACIEDPRLRPIQ